MPADLSAEPPGAPYADVDDPPDADDDSGELLDESPGEDLYATGATGALDMFALWCESMTAAATQAAEGHAETADRARDIVGFIMRQLAHYRVLPGRIRGRLLWQLAHLRTDYASYLSIIASFTREHERRHEQSH